MTKNEFIKAIAGYVQKYAYVYGICVHSPIIAQAILESGWGESKLASQYHNYFGLKCGTKWTGKSVNMATKEEYQPGVLTDIRDNFRAYDSMEEGVKGYFEFIQLARYQNLRGITDPKKYLETIKDDGYATSSAYVTNVYALVTQYNLTQYDTKGNSGMNEAEVRQKPVNYLKQYVGISEGSAQHKAILAVFNDSGLCTRYKMTTGDSWCATGASAAMIATGLADIFPCVECSCGNMVTMAKAAGIWVENDGYVPNKGDHVLYDWDDNGNGDCTGWPDHIGVVDHVSGNTIVVIECNFNNSVGYRNLAVNGRFIRGFITPNYAKKATSSGGGTIVKPSVSKSVTEVANEVLAGQWGNGDFRKNNLTAAGYSYDAVQAEVNRILSGTSSKPTKSVDQVAKEVLAGQWGNGDDRRKKLEAAGYSYSAVQAKVNQLCSGSGGKSVDTLAREIIAGKWGNGSERVKKLKAAGYDPNAVQARVNQLL